MLNLVGQVAFNAINLFDHCFSQDFDFNPDLNIRYRSPRHLVAGIDHRLLPDDQLPKCAVAPSRLDPFPLVLRV